MTMYYIMKDKKIVLYNKSKRALKETIALMPEFADLEIKSTELDIVDFEFREPIKTLATKPLKRVALQQNAGQAIDKPTKPDNTLPASFGGVKNNWSDSLIQSGYEYNKPAILGGDNLNYMLDNVGRNLNYSNTVSEIVCNTPSNKILTVNDENKFEYRDFANPDLSNLTEDGNKHFANPSLSNLDAQGEAKFANPSLSNLDAQGEAKFANPSLSNLDAQGEAKFANPSLSNLNEEGEKHFINKNQVTNCILEAPNGVATYDSNSVTIKKGVKVLIPNGRNEDGTLNNIEYTFTEDKTYPAFTGKGLRYLTLGYVEGEMVICPNMSNYITDPIFSDYFIQDEQPDITGLHEVVWYSPKENKTRYIPYLSKTTTFIDLPIFIFGHLSGTGTSVKTIKTKQPVNLLSYGDLNTIITTHVMPSKQIDVLTIGKTGSIFTAPANGYYQLVAWIQPKTYCYISSVDMGGAVTNNANAIQGFFNPHNDGTGINVSFHWVARKGQQFVIQYNCKMNANTFKFIYTQGEYL